MESPGGAGCPLSPVGRNPPPLGPNGGRLDLHSPRTPHQEELQIDEFCGAEVGHLRADPGEAVAQPPLERPQALPLQAIERVTGGVSLRNHAAREVLPPVVVVSQGAGEFELALAAMAGFPARLQERPGTRVDRRLDRKPARLARDISGWGPQPP